jgi:hypothetical protein
MKDVDTSRIGRCSLWAACAFLGYTTLADAQTSARVQVAVVTDEAEAALALIESRRAGREPSDAQWQRLLQSEGYRALKAREAYMGRAFTDSSFRAFVLSDTLAARVDALKPALEEYKNIDATAAGELALKYLPRGATIRARLLPMIKPRTNSFVFTQDSVQRIFKYIDPTETQEKVANTLAHELHHIGYASVCSTAPASGLTPAVATLHVRLLGFGEGLAMLAAAGSAQVHPHAVSDSATRARWDRDVSSAARDMTLLEQFMLDVLDGRVTSADSVTARAMTFYGEQGPWYTIGWLMGATIERARGREQLVATLCNPVEIMSLHNAVAQQQGNPTWSADLLRRLRRQ